MGAALTGSGGHIHVLGAVEDVATPNLSAFQVCIEFPDPADRRLLRKVGIEIAGASKGKHAPVITRDATGWMEAWETLRKWGSDPALTLAEEIAWCYYRAKRQAYPRAAFGLHEEPTARAYAPSVRGWSTVRPAGRGK